MLCAEFCIAMGTPQDSNRLEPYKFISLSVGPSFPLKNYPVYGGLPGFCGSLTAYSPIKKSPLGGIITLGAGINSSTSFAEGSSPEKPDFKWCTLLAGFAFSRPMHKTTYLDFRCLAGIFFLSLPNVSYSATTINLTAPNYNFVETISSNYNEEFLFDIGISLRPTFKKTLFTISLDYCRGAEKANGVSIYTKYYYPNSTQQYSPPTLVTYPVHTGFINLTLSYGLKLTSNKNK